MLGCKILLESAKAGEGAVNETKVAPETQVAQPSSTAPESGSVENNDSLNSVASEAPKDSSQKDAAWYQEQNKQLKAESARKRDKLNSEREKRKAAEARIEELEKSRPTLESVGGDYDALQKAENEHTLRKVIAEEKLQDVSLSGEGVRNDSLEAVQKANESYVESLKGYFGREGAVSPQAYQSKEAIFNDALMQRSPQERAIIINELSKMDSAPEVIMNVADNPESLYKLATEPSMFQIGSVLNNAKQPKATSTAPPPVPEVGGATGSISDDFDMSTIEGVKAWRKSQGLR